MAKKSIFPRNLTEFGYDFDRDGKLRKIDAATGLTSTEGFEFQVSQDAQYNQKRYEALGEVINEHIYGLLEKEGLRRLPVPRASKTETELRSFIFASDDAFENDKLMILIHGSGVVRAGQWARRLIINESLNSGTQIPYVTRAKDLGYGVLILNTNDNQRLVGNETKKIPGSEEPHAHTRTVWSDYVRSSKADKIVIVAHSYGGVCTVKFAMENRDEFVKRVFAVAFTDSVHSHVMPTKGTDHILEVVDYTHVCHRQLHEEIRRMMVGGEASRGYKRGEETTGNNGNSTNTAGARMRCTRGWTRLRIFDTLGPLGTYTRALALAKYTCVVSYTHSDNYRSTACTGDHRVVYSVREEGGTGLPRRGLRSIWGRALFRYNSTA